MYNLQSTNLQSTQIIYIQSTSPTCYNYPDRSTNQCHVNNRYNPTTRVPGHSVPCSIMLIAHSSQLIHVGCTVGLTKTSNRQSQSVKCTRHYSVFPHSHYTYWKILCSHYTYILTVLHCGKVHSSGVKCREQCEEVILVQFERALCRHLCLVQHTTHDILDIRHGIRQRRTSESKASLIILLKNL